MAPSVGGSGKKLKLTKKSSKKKKHSSSSSSDEGDKKHKLAKPKSLKKKHSHGKHSSSSSSSDDDGKKHKLTKVKSSKEEDEHDHHSSSSSDEDGKKLRLTKAKSLNDEHSHDKHSSSSSDEDGKKLKLTKVKSSKDEHEHDKHSSSSSDEDGKKHKLTKAKSLKEEHGHDKHSSSSSDEDGKKLKLTKVKSLKDEHSHDKHSSSSSSDEDGKKLKLTKVKSLKDEHSHDKHSSSSSSDEDGKKLKLTKVKSSSSSDADGKKLKLTKANPLNDEHSHDKHSSSSSSSDESGSKHKLEKVKSLKDEHSHDKHSSSSSSSDEDGKKLKLTKVKSSKEEHSHDKHSGSSSSISSSISRGLHLYHDQDSKYYHDEQEYEIVSRNSAYEQIGEALTIYGAAEEESRKEQFGFGKSRNEQFASEELRNEQYAFGESRNAQFASAESRNEYEVVSRNSEVVSRNSAYEHIAEALTIYGAAGEESRNAQFGFGFRESRNEQFTSEGSRNEQYAFGERRNAQSAFGERVEEREQARGIRDESDDGGGGGAREVESWSKRAETEGFHGLVLERVSVSELEQKVEFPESEDDVDRIQEKGDAQSITSAQVAVDGIEEDEEAMVETSDAVSQEDAKHAETASAQVEERETSDVAERRVERRSSESTKSEQLQQNLNSLHEPVFANSREIEGKSEHDDDSRFEEEDEKEAGGRDLIMDVRQNKLPTPSKHLSSVYKIVMSLEGSQVGEKCIHGEIDHGLCHHRHGAKKPSSPGSARLDWSRDSSTSPKAAFRDAARTSSGEVRTSSGEVDNEWRFVQQQDSSTSATQVSSETTTKTETYTDTLLFRRDDGILVRTLGASPLSQQSMRAVVSQVEGSSSSASDTPKVKIVHEFSAEQQESETDVTTSVTTEESESEVEKILRLQETHDLVCPVCRSCITKRVILRKRKRISTVSSVETWNAQGVEDEVDRSESHGEVTNTGEQTVVEQYENYGCLNCFTFLFRLERSAKSTEVVEVPQAPEEAPGTLTLSEPVAALPPAPTAEDHDNRCLPVFFTWRRKTTISTDSDIVAPLLSEEEREQGVQTKPQDISSEVVIQQSSTESEEISVSEIQEASSSVTQPPDSGTLPLPTAPAVVEDVQIPVVVVEFKEDRLCFPFLWTRGTKTTQVHPELTEPLLTKEEPHPKSPKADEAKQQQALQEEDFDRIEDNWWMRREVCLEVPVSEPPREEEEARTPEPSPDTPSAATSRVTEEERRVNCLCFPSWVSSETTVVETEGASATEEFQASTPTTASGGSEITTRLPSFKDAVASDREVEKARLNCIEILVPSYPWGPPGEGRMQEVTEDRSEIAAAAALPPFRFIRVALPESKGSLVFPVAESPEIPASQPDQSVVVEQAVERREDSTCFPLSLPALSWRRVEPISREIQDNSETSTTDVKPTETKPSEPPLLQEKPVETEFTFGEIETSRNQQKQSSNDSANELVEEEEEEEPLVRKSPAPKKPEAEPLPLPEPEPVVEHESVTVVSEEKDETGDSLPEIIEKDLSFSPELTTAEVITTVTTPELPVVGEGATKEKESFNCCLPLYYQPSYQPLEVAERVTTTQASAAASETLPQSSVSHIYDALGTSETITEEETGSWNCCLPTYTQLAYQPPEAPLSDALVGAPPSGFKTVHEEVKKETTIDARNKIEETTTAFAIDSEHNESKESVKVDSKLSYIHDKVQHDKGETEGTFHLDDHPTLSFHPVGVDFKPAPQQPAHVTGFRSEEVDETEAKVKESLAELPTQGVGEEEIPPPTIGQDEVQITEATEHDVEQGGRQDDEEDGACCVPRSKWFWGRWNYTTDEAQLREPLLGDDSAQAHPEAVHVEVEQEHEVTVTTADGDDARAAAAAVEEEWCRCFPWSRAGVTDTVSTTVTVTTDTDTVIEVDGTDATSTLEAATHAAEDIGMIMDEPGLEGGYLKSIVYGGLDVSLTSLGVVAAAAGGDAKMRNIIALGLSNLIFGFLTFFYKIQSLHNEGPARFHESVGPRFWINGPLAMLSFLLFGALPVLTFALSFRDLNDHSFKMAATAFASLIAVVFLGCGQVAAKMTELSYKRNLTGLIMTGIVASLSAYYAGDYISRLLAQAGIFDE